MLCRRFSTAWPHMLRLMKAPAVGFVRADHPFNDMYDHASALKSFKNVDDPHWTVDAFFLPPPPSP